MPFGDPQEPALPTPRVLVARALRVACAEILGAPDPALEELAVAGLKIPDRHVSPARERGWIGPIAERLEEPVGRWRAEMIAGRVRDALAARRHVLEERARIAEIAALWIGADRDKARALGIAIGAGVAAIDSPRVLKRAIARNAIHGKLLILETRDTALLLAALPAIEQARGQVLLRAGVADLWDLAVDRLGDLVVATDESDDVETLAAIAAMLLL